MEIQREIIKSKNQKLQQLLAQKQSDLEKIQQLDKEKIYMNKHNEKLNIVIATLKGEVSSLGQKTTTCSNKIKIHYSGCNNFKKGWQKRNLEGR